MIGLYYEAKPRTSTEVDAYWLYNSQVRDYRFPTSAAFIPDRHFSSVGGRVSHRVRRAFTVGGEFAYQFGNQRGNAQRSVPNANVRAWGGYGHVRRDFDHSWKPFVQVAEYFYSGDEHEADDRANGFDPVFGRWPGRSELLAYGLQTEKGFGYYSNLRLTGIQGGFLPLKQWKNTLSYYRVDAFHPNRAGSPHIFGSGTHRGDLFGVKSEVALKDHWKAHLMYERMLPGDFYVGDNHAHFFRVELMYTFKAVLSR